MLDLVAVQLALRNRAIAVSVCTTGSATLAATVDGYTRLTGSFITDGFKLGMEVTPTGFTQTTTGVVVGVTALTLTIDGGRTVEASGSGRTLAVGLPALRAWEHVKFEPIQNRPYVDEDFMPTGSELLSFPAQSGILEERGIYVLRYHGVANRLLSGIQNPVAALKALFTPGTGLTAGSNVVRVRSDIGPYSGPILPDGKGFEVCTLTVPWFGHSNNAIAA